MGCCVLYPCFATVLFNVCIAVTVECCVLYPCCVSVFGIRVEALHGSHVFCLSSHVICKFEQEIHIVEVSYFTNILIK